MNYQKLNTFSGWLIWIIATYVYISTIEPTASFWDCGEFIASSYKLEVGHPPGAPFFMLLGRLFSLWASPENAAMLINIMSALCSSFTILFLFWTITALAKKIALSSGELNTGKTIAILGSGFVGGLAYTFSDSFWFSAVEGEVYAMSSLFTAVVFWAILKWEAVADEKHANRWLVLIAYLMGLSIGVHLLNLLAIPAIAFVYYFRKYKVTRKGITIAFLTSVIILAAIQYGIVPWTVILASKFELLFVNSFGLPFNSGLIFYLLLLAGGIYWALNFTRKKGMVVANTITLCFTVIMIGYGTFGIVVIRSMANPPMDENNPENAFTLLSYLNREQYGDRPLLYGNFFDSPLDNQEPYSDGDPVYYQDKEKGKYIISDDKKSSVPNYAEEFNMLFPRMYSSDSKHVAAYRSWSNFRGKPIRYHTISGETKIINKPTFGENLQFFFSYQVGWMYWRYFMWNFSGRQNDEQGHGNFIDGNWISGIKFIDEARLGPQEKLPANIAQNQANNKFYLIPFIIGLIGLFFLLFKSIKDFAIVALLFFFTGLAIVVYLNQYPYQPRERDYAYAASFYAFTIWIGLGVYALFSAAFTKKINEMLKFLGGILGLALFIYVVEFLAKSEHEISPIIAFIDAIAFALLIGMNMLGKIIKNNIIISIIAVLLCTSVPYVMAKDGWDDHDRSNTYTARDFAKNYLASCAPNAILFTNGDNDTFPLWYVQEVEEYRTDVRVVNLSLLNTDWYIDQVKRKAYDSEPVPFKLTSDKYRQGTRDYVPIRHPQGDKKDIYLDVKVAMDFISEEKNMALMGSERRMNYFPTGKFSLKVDTAKVLTNGTVPASLAGKIVPEVKWEIDRSYVLKNDMMILDLLAHNNWDRPVYFAITTGNDSYIGLENYFQLEGLAYHLIPVPAEEGDGQTGRVNTDIMYDNLMHKFNWGGMDKSKIYMNENNRRMCMNIRNNFARLAEAFIKEGKKDKAIEVLDKCVEVIPERNVPYDFFMLPVSEAYYKAGAADKANAIVEKLADVYVEQLNYYFSLNTEMYNQISTQGNQAMSVLYRLNMLTNRDFPQDSLGKKIKDQFDGLQTLYGQRQPKK